MTENKRFTLDEDRIQDNQSPCCYIEYYKGLIPIVDLLNKLAEENQRLKNDCSILVQSNQEYRKENEQLQERNNRQCKQLDDLYRLIEEKDWRALSDILDDFQKAEEQLQSEWKCYE